MEYQGAHILRLVEQLDALIRRASRSAPEQGGGAGPRDTDAAIAMAVGVDPAVFLSLSPQSMRSFLEMSGLDDRVVERLARILELQADIFEGEGSLIEAGVRREQAAAVRVSTDPAQAN
jgi:hypothetical protein